MKILILNEKTYELVREIEIPSDRTWVEDATPSGSEIGTQNLVDFFESCEPPHTGSVVSGSIVEDRDEYFNLRQKYFYGETYLIQR